MQQLALAVPFQKSRSLLGFCWLHVALFHVDWGSAKGVFCRACAALLLLCVWCFRSTPCVQWQRALLDACNKGRDTLPLHRDDAIDETHAVQGPRSARQTSSETAATHRSRFASRRFRALQPPSAEFCCEEMPRQWDSIGTPRCCRDLRNEFNHFARPSGASEP